MKKQYEEKIITTLENYMPKPSLRFYRNMSESPWTKKEQPVRQSNFRRFAIGFSAMLLVGIALCFSIPSVRAAIWQYLGLKASPSGTMDNLAVPPESLVESQKLTEMSNLSGWSIKTPSWMPDGYLFNDAWFDSSNEMVLLTFVATRQLPGNDPTMTETKTVTMVQSVHNDILPLMVAPTTNVLDVTINGQPAAYAVGAWESDASTGQATWNSNYSLQNVYWQIDTVYMMLDTDDPLVSKENLLKIAESTK